MKNKYFSKKKVYWNLNKYLTNLNKFLSLFKSMNKKSIKVKTPLYFIFKPKGNLSQRDTIFHVTILFCSLKGPTISKPMVIIKRVCDTLNMY